MIERRVRIPKSRDPFVNARLISLGCDQRGRERFWISSVNFSQGSTGVVVDEEGQYRVYRLNKPKIGYCYSAAPEDGNTLWLCVNLSKMARLNLRTGAYDMYDTGAGNAFVCCGGTLDPATGKFFTIGYLGTHGREGTTAISFDVKTKKTVIHRNVAPDQFMYTCCRNANGTYTGLVVCPGASLIHWNPRTETIEYIRVLEHMSTSPHPVCVADDSGRPYFPGHGWYDIKKRAFAADGPRPEREALWFERRGNQVFGFEEEPSIGARIYAWDMHTGKVRFVTTLPNCHHGLAISKSGSLVSLDIYGEFRRHDIATGRLELYRRLKTDAVAGLDQMLRLDKNRLLGTPFISQRFWEVNLKTGKGFDCGRAAPGGGQVQHFWKVGGKVYLTAYTTGNLLEYDPAEHPHFPENPRVVAEPPESMRPVAFAADSRHIYYSSGAPYGKLGSTVTKYDTQTGQYIFNVNPVKDQYFRHIWLDRRQNVLLCHTDFHADCDSCPPTTDVCYLVKLSAKNLAVLEATPLPNTIRPQGILGPLDSNRLLCRFTCTPEGQPRQCCLAAIDREQFPPPATEQLRPMPKMRSFQYAGKPGLFVAHREDRVELWDMRQWKCLKLFRKDKTIVRVLVQDRSLYLAHQRDIVILDGVL